MKNHELKLPTRNRFFCYLKVLICPPRTRLFAPQLALREEKTFLSPNFQQNVHQHSYRAIRLLWDWINFEYELKSGKLSPKQEVLKRSEQTATEFDKHTICLCLLQWVTRKILTQGFPSGIDWLGTSFVNAIQKRILKTYCGNFEGHYSPRSSLML